MRRIRRANRLSIAVAVLLLSATAAALFLAVPASATAAIQVSPSTGLTAGQTVAVTGSGYDANSTGAVLECNNAAGQPTIPVLGNAIPVSCTNPLSNLQSTDAGGNLNATFTISTGVTGPPGTGTDSSGGEAATDAASYPCPPTAAQISAGVSCVISYGDQGGAQATTPISIGGGTTTTTQSTTTSQPTTTTTQPTTTTTTPLPGYLTVVAGQPTMIQGAGFKVGESVSADIHSLSVHLAVLTANSIGVAVGSVTIPMGTMVGYHEIIMTGASSGHVDTIPAWIIQGSAQPVTSAGATGITTSGASSPGATTAAATPAASTPGATPHTSSLAYTGAGRGVLVTLAGGLLLLNMGYLVMTMFCRPRELARSAGRVVRRSFRDGR